MDDYKDKQCCSERQGCQAVPGMDAEIRADKNVYDLIGKLRGYAPHEVTTLYDCFNELCKNGIGKGCYQDYGLLSELLSIINLALPIASEV